MIGMPTIDEQLLRDENILASAKGISSGRLYATNKRVIRYEKGLFGEKVNSLFYNHISTCALDNRSYWWLAILGAILLLLSAGNGFIVISGLILFLYGIFHRQSWYQIKPTELADKTTCNMWRTQSTDEDAKTFARFIQDQISARELSGTGRNKEEAIPPVPATARQQGQAGDDTSSDEDNLKLLKKRLAQGKITEKEYKKLKKVLEK